MQRVQVLVRIALLFAIGYIGWSSVYWALYLALPIVAIVLVSSEGAEGYLRLEAPGMIRVLRWFAGAYAYLWLLTDAFPTTGPGGPVQLEIDVDGKPTASSAGLRLLTSLPALVLLAVLTMAAALLWIVGAVSILATERMPAAISDFIAMKVRYQFRLVAYHLSLVQEYPALVDGGVHRVQREQAHSGGV